MDKMQIFDFLGMTKDGEIDEAKLKSSMEGVAKKAAEISKFDTPNMQLMQTPGPMTNMDAQMMQQNMPNPYAPVNYGIQQPAGPMTDRDAAMMRQYAPQNMGMMQIMEMLKRAGY